MTGVKKTVNVYAVQEWQDEKTPSWIVRNSDDSEYQLWMYENEQDLLRTEKLDYQPLISVIVPVYNTETVLLRACFDSVLHQTYANWELIMVDDCSSMETVRPDLQAFAAEDKRVKVFFREKNGHISRCTNDGIARAEGEFIAFMDCDDMLSPNALYEMVRKLNENPDLDFLYSDEDKISEDGRFRHIPFFKPDWSPDTYFSINYTNHLSMFRREKAEKAGLLRPEFDGAQDYDFTLRFVETCTEKKIGHVSKILYHWRERAGSTAVRMGEKNYAIDANIRAREEAFKRRGIRAHIAVSDSFPISYPVYENADYPLVSIVIPSKDNPGVLKSCLDSLLEKTTYPSYEIILVDNGSSETVKKQLTELFSDYAKQFPEHPITYLYRPMAFNFSRMCNIGAGEAKGKFVLLLNDDIEICEENWLDVMVGQARLPYVGAVGAKLYYPDSRQIQHCGVVNLPVGPSHMLCFADDAFLYYFGRNLLPYNYLAVTGACLLVEKAKYDEVGGMHEKLAVAYNDIDFCFSLYEHGYYTVCRNDVVLYHHESLSRGLDSEQEDKMTRLAGEREYLYRRHPSLAGKDPFYNSNLAKNRGNFVVEVSGDTFLTDETVCLPGAPGRFQNFTIQVDEMNSRRYMTIRGWMSIGDERLEREGIFYLLLQGRKSQIIRVPIFPYRRYDDTQALGLTSGCIGYCATVSNAYVYGGIARIGIAVKDGEEWIHAWTNKEAVVERYDEPEAYPLSEFDLSSASRRFFRSMRFHVDSFTAEDGELRIEGWGFRVRESRNTECALQILLVGDDAEEKEGYLCKIRQKERPDVQEKFPRHPHLGACGFSLHVRMPETLAGKRGKVYLLSEHMTKHDRKYCCIGEWS